MKLEKLILSGFKSFADRTEFEFDRGVSCVVGPNGCGKSNIVDAVKWVLGEQSAKSLRGSEMADVIFNGSAARRSSGMAEVTLVFDNADGMLQTDVKSDSVRESVVSIARRLYRSGQSEYLINKTPCRLKDVREMFMDTGIGRDAYSVIEQGRVELFLQASQDERRAIFDEAAGISKYKARKKEALRKLERVEQNLLRLSDILGEVAKRLRSIKYQAGKARSYRTYTQRLVELRSLYFLAQYHQLSGQRNALRRQVDAGSDALAAVTARIDQLEASRSGTEVEAVDLERTARELEGRAAAIGAQISTCEQRAEMLAGRVTELGQEIVRTSSQWEQLEARAEELDQQLRARNEQRSRSEAAAAELAAQHEAARDEHAAGEKAIAHLDNRLADEKAGTIDLLRRTAQLHNEIQASSIRRENLHGQKARLAERADQIEHSLRLTLAAHGEVKSRLDDVAEVLAGSQAGLDEARRQSQHLIETENDLQKRLATAREDRSGILSRIAALEEMQQRLEGVGAGVRNVLQARREGRLQTIRGMLGEFLQADVDRAAVVEAALAGADQHLLAERMADVEAARDELNRLIGDNGTVEVLCLDRIGPFASDFDVAAAGAGEESAPLIVARVIDWVRFDGWLAPAVWQLLGRTLVVRSLADAVAAARTAPAGWRFVTLGGEVVELDGRVRLGAANRAAGVIARRSELAELRCRVEQLDQDIAGIEADAHAAREQRQHLEETIHSLRTAIYEANTERVECDSRLAQLDEQIAELQRERPLIAEDLRQLAEEIDQAVAAEHQAKEKAAELERLNEERDREVARLNEQIAAARGRQEELAARMTETKVALAQAQEKSRALAEAIAALDRRRDEMQQELSAGRAQVAQARQRRAEAEAGIAKAKEDVERLYAEHERINREVEEVEETRRGLQEKLEQIRQQLAERRKAHQQLAEQVNGHREELGKADVRIEGLITRASEAGMNLLQQSAGYEHDEQRDWPAVETEIQELNGKIERLGNVNLDAIDEQDELEKREAFLTGQLEDIRRSQHQLDELIKRINRESRELFVTTFEAVRKNFQELFRKLFGGGRADIMLLNPEDVLESGIEIVARPPGKDLRSLSLLSGGEKTMTALAMLFSIFRTRPSPFCLLDEVDAALDEPNTERFSRLLQEFVADSQFIIISHAKRTMSMANVLYGVTMQEPGVSRRISVRFEDVGEKLDRQLEPVAS